MSTTSISDLAPPSGAIAVLPRALGRNLPQRTVAVQVACGAGPAGHIAVRAERALYGVLLCGVAVMAGGFALQILG